MKNPVNPEPAGDPSAVSDLERTGAAGSEATAGDSSGEGAAADAGVRAGMDDATTQAQKHWEQLVQTTADFDNYKKRAVRERMEAVKNANEGLVKTLIPILDNFDMALAAVNQGSGQNLQALQTGVAMIHQQLRTALTDAGLTEINAEGQRFDPNVHEAVSQLETADTPEDHVVQQLRKGYKLRDRLLRPAMVVVAKKPSS